MATNKKTAPAQTETPPDEKVPVTVQPDTPPVDDLSPGGVVNAELPHAQIEAAQAGSEPFPAANASEIAEEPLYIVTSPLRHDGVKYAPGDEIAAGVFPDDLAEKLLHSRVIRQP